MLRVKKYLLQLGFLGFSFFSPLRGANQVKIMEEVFGELLLPPVVIVKEMGLSFKLPETLRDLEKNGDYIFCVGVPLQNQYGSFISTIGDKYDSSVSLSSPHRILYRVESYKTCRAVEMVDTNYTLNFLINMDTSRGYLYNTGKGFGGPAVTFDIHEKTILQRGSYKVVYVSKKINAICQYAETDSLSLESFCELDVDGEGHIHVNETYGNQTDFLKGSLSQNILSL